MPKKTPPFPEYEKWTTSKFWNFIRSALRSAWTRWPPKYVALNNAKRRYTGNDPRRRYSYECAACKELFKGKEVQVDHIEECGSLNKYEDLPEFVRKLFVSEDKLQILCKECHKGKTNG